MQHAVQTANLPGRAPSDRPYDWTVRGRHGSWQLEIPMRDRGTRAHAPARPEQADWLRAHGLGAPDKWGRVSVDAAQLGPIFAAIDALADPPGIAAAIALDAMSAHLVSGDADAARACADQLRALAPDWALARQRRLELLVYHLGDMDAADIDLAELPDGMLAAEVLRNARIRIALHRHDYVSYEREYTALVAAGFRDPAQWETLGLARWACDRLDDAVRAFDDGLVDHPGHPDLLRRKAEVRIAQGAHDAGLAILRTLADADPADTRSRALVGWTLRDTDPAAAAAHYAAALEADPDCIMARVGRGLQRLDAGDRAGAHADIDPFGHCGWAGALDAWTRLHDSAEE